MNCMTKTLFVFNKIAYDSTSFFMKSFCFHQLHCRKLTCHHDHSHQHTSSIFSAQDVHLSIKDQVRVLVDQILD